MTETLKAISLWQPWASLWLTERKLHETRDWATEHRGKLLVHAAKKFVRDVEGELDHLLTDEFGGRWAMDLPTGALLGIIVMEDCVPCEQVTISHDDGICGNWYAGRFGWRRGPTFWRFRRPVPYRGRQRLFDVPADAVKDACFAADKVELAA